MNIYGIPSAMEWGNFHNYMLLCSEGPSSVGADADGFGVFVELGMYLGGLAGPFIDRSRRVPHFHYIGFEWGPERGGSELDPRVVQWAAESPNAHLRVEDMLAEPAITFVRSILDSIGGRKALFLVDGFNKPKEFGVYFDVARIGDHICVHDFNGMAGGNEDLMQQKDIEPYLAAGRVRPFYPDWWIWTKGLLSVVKIAA